MQNKLPPVVVVVVVVEVCVVEEPLASSKAVKVHCMGFTRVKPRLQLMQLKAETEHWLQFAILQVLTVVTEVTVVPLEEMDALRPTQEVPTNVNEGSH